MEAKGTCTNAPTTAFLPWPEGNSPCAGSDLSRVTEAKAFKNISPTKAQGQMSCGMYCGFFSPHNALCAAPQNSLNICVHVDVNLYQKLCGQAKQDHFCCCQEITGSITVSYGHSCLPSATDTKAMESGGRKISDPQYGFHPIPKSWVLLVVLNTGHKDKRIK